MNSTFPELSVVLPCRNEEDALGYCLKEIQEVFIKNNINGEIIVSDSSTDRSPEIAQEFGAILVKHDQVGYGRAYLEGIKAAKGRYLFLADADATYDFKEIPKFLEYLKGGANFVIGDRFKGKMEKGAMPWAHKYIGNPVLSGILRVLFWSKVSDVHCGMRAVTKDALQKMNLQTTGMEFASEMVIKAAKKNLQIKEIPIDYRRRKGQSKLNPLVDGWRHLRFMLLYSPLFLFFLPGFLFFLLGSIASLLIYFDLTILGRTFSYHPLFLTICLTIVGYQLIIFGFFAKTYATTHLGETSRLMDSIHKHVTVEKSILFGTIFIILGSVFYSFIFIQWVSVGFGELQEIKRSLLALTFVILGIQTIFSSFMLSILGIKEK